MGGGRGLLGLARPSACRPAPVTTRSPTSPRRSSRATEPTRGASSNDKKQLPAAAGRRWGAPAADLSTKIHLVADDRCRPIARIITPGQRHDAVAFEPLMGAIRIRRRSRGRPRTQPGRVRGDKAYSSRSNRAQPRRRQIQATIPERADQQANRAHRGSRGGRPPQLKPEDYKQRNTVERAINKKELRAVPARYDKREYIFAGTVDVASIRIWLRDPRPMIQGTRPCVDRLRRLATRRGHDGALRSGELHARH